MASLRHIGPQRGFIINPHIERYVVYLPRSWRLLRNYSSTSGGKSTLDDDDDTADAAQLLHIIFAISISSSETGAIKSERGGKAHFL